MRWLAGLLLCLIANVALAQNITCPTRPTGDSSNACASTQFLQNSTHSVIAFGAKCDGVTNDATAIQAALNAVVAPGSVVLPPGTCVINSGLTKPLGVSVYGAGQGATILAVGANNVTAFTLTYGSITIDRSDISNLQIDCGATTGGTGISATFARQFNIRNLTVSGCPTSITLDRGTSYRIENVTSSGNVSQGAGVLNIRSTDDTTYIFDVIVHAYYVANVGNGVQGNAIYCRRCVGSQFSQIRMNDLVHGGSARVGIVVENDSQGNQFTDAVLSGPSSGILQQTGAGVNVAPTFTSYKDISVDMPSTNAFTLTTGSRTQITNGMFTASGATTTIPAVTIAAAAIETSITGTITNGFTGAGGACLSIASASDNITYSANTCDNNTNGIIWAGASTNTRVFGNRFNSVTTVYNGTTTGAGNNFENNDGSTTPCTQTALGTINCNAYSLGGTTLWLFDVGNFYLGNRNGTGFAFVTDTNTNNFYRALGHTFSNSAGSTSYGTVAAAGITTGNGFIAGGSPPTLSGTCTTGTQTGGNTAGTFTATCTAQTVIITFAQSAPTGWSCNAHDRTTPADSLNQTASTVSSATLTGTTAAADVITFNCLAY